MWASLLYFHCLFAANIYFGFQIISRLWFVALFHLLFHKSQHLPVISHIRYHIVLLNLLMKVYKSINGWSLLTHKNTGHLSCYITPINEVRFHCKFFSSFKNRRYKSISKTICLFVFSEPFWRTKHVPFSWNLFIDSVAFVQFHSRPLYHTNTVTIIYL